VLKGLDVYLAMASFKSGAGDFVKGTSPAVSFRIQ